MTDQRTAPVLYAFSCTTNDPEDARTVFAPSHARARREYLGEGISGGSAEIRRKPSFDQYSPGPVPAMALLEEGWYFECSGCSRRISMDEPTFENATKEELSRIAARNAKVRRDLKAFESANPEPPKVDESLSHPDKWNLRRERETWHRRRHDINLHHIDPPLSRMSIRVDGDYVFCDHVCQMKHLDGIADIDLAHEDAEIEAERRWPGAPSYTSKRYPYLDPNVHFRPEGFEHDVTWRVETDDVLVHPVDMEGWNALEAALEHEGESKDGASQDDR
jgi:hypothetical protein